MGKIVVAVSGGFDPLHVGHVKYFNEAKNLGNKLVVILNTDEWLQNKKGYVFMSFNERKEILENLRSVDEVIKCIDRDNTVIKTLMILKPDIFAKGGDRTVENTPEQEICQKLGIKIVFGVGGNKVQSSSWLIDSATEKILLQLAKDREKNR